MSETAKKNSYIDGARLLAFKAAELSEKSKKIVFEEKAVSPAKEHLLRLATGGVLGFGSG